MVNAWVLFVKQYAKNNHLSYGCCLSMPECSASYKQSKGQKIDPKVAPKIDPKDKAHSDLIRIAEQSKKLKPRAEPRVEPHVEPMEGTVVKRKSKQMVQVPIYFIKSNFKKKADLNKAVKKAEKESEEAMKYLSSFPDKSRHHFKQVIYGVINDFDEIHRIENELTEPDMSPSMIASRQARLKETENAIKDKLEELQFKGFVPKFL